MVLHVRLSTLLCLYQVHSCSQWHHLLLKMWVQAMFTGMGNGLTIRVVVFTFIFFKGNLLTATFTTTPGVIQQGYNFLKGFALETIVTAVLFSMVGYFNGHDQTLWVMIQGLIQTLLVRLPLAYYMSIQPYASLTNIGLAAPTATAFSIILNICFFFYLQKKLNVA